MGKHKYILLASAVLASVAMAQSNPPLRHAKCEVEVQHPNNSAGVVMAKDCKTAYVLPPVTGQVSLVGVTNTAQLRLCPGVNSAMDRISKIEAQSLELQNTLDNAILVTEEEAVKPPPKDPFRDPFKRKRPKKPAPRKITEAQRAELEKQLQDARKLMTDVAKDYGSIYGSSAQINFVVPWAELVNEYNRVNRDVSFVPMPLKSGAISFRKFVSRPDMFLSALVSTEIAGVPVYHNTPSKKGVNKPPKDESEEENRYEDTQSVEFTNAKSGQVDLTLVGSCPFYDASTGRIMEEIDEREIVTHLAANFSYTYDAVAYRAYVAKYNLAGLIRKIVSASTNGGLFHTSTATSMIQSKEASDWFSFESISDDSDYPIDEVAKDIKADLMGRVLKNIAIGFGTPGSESTPGLIAPPVNGARTAADELGKCYHVYCQVASGAFRIMDALFGSSEASAEFISSFDYEARDDVKSYRAFRYAGDTVFAPSNY